MGNGDETQERAGAASWPTAHEGGPRYRPLLGPEQLRVARWRRLGDAWARLAAPLRGHALLFPRRLDAALAALRRGASAVPPRLEEAEHYFGAGLLVWVPPRRLCWQLLDVVTDGRRSFRLAHRFLDAGDWSGAAEPLASSVVHLEMAALCQPGTAYRNSGVYRYMLERAAAGQPERRNGVALATPALVEAYFTHYAALRDGMRREGYRPRHALPPAPAHALRGVGAERREGEAGLAIGPRGEVLRLLGGRHRTALAQLLDLPAMPGRVRLVHAAWLAAEAERLGLPPHRALPEALAALQARLREG
ncbi:hypothetical protein CR162_00220 [Pseudoroseomonas rhizosphaerae]|uniref:Uncharacterized protein n=1 Tax=Teichococcus rhizosphaerae TaxID=1335062 RepID=A0A2C7AFJ4_9PROT|nr:hypothetical protein [Pseudoroseomonas rhizosphaerae]PHK96839.1 hypothetical protein CR162_00220 [Pseudoroseomonas rhizosphaerae]